MLLIILLSGARVRHLRSVDSGAAAAAAAATATAAAFDTLGRAIGTAAINKPIDYSHERLLQLGLGLVQLLFSIFNLFDQIDIN